MKTKETSLKRFTFQGIINTEQEKLPEKSRSKSNNRSKASSITKNNLNITNRSNKSNSKTNKVEPKLAKMASEEENAAKAANESIFRSTKRNLEQQLMKKIIKLKNSTIQLENTMKQKQANRSQVHPSPTDKENEQQLGRFQEIHSFLQEFDAQIRKQTKQIGQFYSKQLDDLQTTESQSKQFEIQPFKSLVLPHISPSMPTLESKLKQLENSWLKV